MHSLPSINQNLNIVSTKQTLQLNTQLHSRGQDIDLSAETAMEEMYMWDKNYNPNVVGEMTFQQYLNEINPILVKHKELVLKALQNIQACDMNNPEQEILCSDSKITINQLITLMLS